MVLDKKKSNFGNQQCLWFYIWSIRTLKCDRHYYKMWQLFYYKMRQKFITKCDRCFITKCDNYYKVRQFNYKMRQLLKKCDDYYKMHHCWTEQVKFKFTNRLAFLFFEFDGIRLLLILYFFKIFLADAAWKLCLHPVEVLTGKILLFLIMKNMLCRVFRKILRR